MLWLSLMLASIAFHTSPDAVARAVHPAEPRRYGGQDAERSDLPPRHPPVSFALMYALGVAGGLVARRL